MTDKDIPHGHGLSYKRGASDGLLDKNEFESVVHPTHLASYRRGVEEGKRLQQLIAERVMPEVIGK